MSVVTKERQLEIALAAYDQQTESRQRMWLLGKSSPGSRTSGSPSNQHAGKTHCKNGHEFNEVNTWVRRNADGSTARACRLCRNERERARRAAA